MKKGYRWIEWTCISFKFTSQWPIFTSRSWLKMPTHSILQLSSNVLSSLNSFINCFIWLVRQKYDDNTWWKVNFHRSYSLTAPHSSPISGALCMSIRANCSAPEQKRNVEHILSKIHTREKKKKNTSTKLTKTKFIIRIRKVHTVFTLHHGKGMSRARKQSVKPLYSTWAIWRPNLTVARTVSVPNFPLLFCPKQKVFCV